MEKTYSSGEFARKAHVTLRTIRYYDRENVLTPSGRTPSGARLYTDDDFARLQQILLFKYLGFSLADIRELTVAGADRRFLEESLHLQKRLMEQRIEQMKGVLSAIDRTVDAVGDTDSVDWTSMLDLIHLTAEENSLKVQYQNATNIAARIRLHRDYSTNRQGWFPWIFSQLPLRPGMRILEIGCGNGALWSENLDKIPEGLSVTLTDLSDGMVREVRDQFLTQPGFSFAAADAHKLPFPDHSFDLVIANHVLFYCSDLPQALQECRRVLAPGGQLCASTYGKRHMAEITKLVQDYNPEIVLSVGEHLYDRFGLDNGKDLLSSCFPQVCCLRYEDAIEIADPDPLVQYILSCHGNQNGLLLNHYKEFRDFVADRTRNGFHITKEAGIFLCTAP